MPQSAQLCFVSRLSIVKMQSDRRVEEAAGCAPTAVLRAAAVVAIDPQRGVVAGAEVGLPRHARGRQSGREMPRRAAARCARGPASAPRSAAAWVRLPAHAPTRAGCWSCSARSARRRRIVHHLGRRDAASAVKRAHRLARTDHGVHDAAYGVILPPPRDDLRSSCRDVARAPAPDPTEHCDKIAHARNDRA